MTNEEKKKLRFLFERYGNERWATGFSEAEQNQKEARKRDNMANKLRQQFYSIIEEKESP